MKQDYTFLIGGGSGAGAADHRGCAGKGPGPSGAPYICLPGLPLPGPGGHNFYQVRAASFPVGSHLDEVTMLVALDEETIKIHGHRVGEGGVVLYDSEEMPSHEGLANSLPVPLKELEKTYGGQGVMGNSAARP